MTNTEADLRRRERIISLCWTVSGWATFRGKCALVQDIKKFNLCEEKIDEWILELEKFIRGDGA